jgi:aminoglycoside phosphotransferase (APT) family kinase protein
MPGEAHVDTGSDGQQLTAVRDAHRFDEDSLARYLGRHMSGVRAALRVHQFEGGQSNPTFLLESGGERWVMRKKPPGELVPSAHAVDREFRVIAALADSDVPVPRVHHLCEDPEVIGTPFYVMEYVEGRICREIALPEFSPQERAAVFDSLNEVIAALHRVDYEAVGLGNFGKVGGYIERQVARWIRQYEASKTEEVPAMNALMAWLPNHIPADDRTSIVHGDFRLENVVLHPEEPRLLAVLDWELCTLGHPYADFAYNCMPFHLAPGEQGSLGGLDLEALGFPTESDYVAAYARRTGRDRIPDWPFYMVFSMFRLAAIAQGVYMRGLRGNAASEEALERGARAKSLAERGWEIAQRELGA